MPAKSKTENVRKICACKKWKLCSHAWYLDYQRDGVRYRDNLDRLIGRHPVDFTEAKDEARRAIVAKLNGRDPKDLQPSDDPTVHALLTEYERERPRRDRYQVPQILKTKILTPSGGLRPFGEWRASTINVETLKQFRHARPRIAGNRDLTLLRAAFNWAVLHGLVLRTPFRIGGVPAVRIGTETARTRRLQPGEAERILEAAGSRSGLRDIIVAALETGMRHGEILTLQVHQVRFAPRAEIFVPAHIAKQKRDRRIPISSVLRAVLEARLVDPVGHPLPPDAFVFGNEIGRPRQSIQKAWEGTRRRAMVTDLHFHDLRREAGSRWMDAGIPLATIQRWLGHANISQTSTYLGASLGADELDMRAYEERIGRVPPLTQIDTNDSSIRPETTSDDRGADKNTNKDAVVH